MSDVERVLETATAAFERFRHGLATGDWAGWFACLAEDVAFSFPIGKYRGVHVGKAKAVEFFTFVAQTFPDGLTLELDRVVANGATAVFEFRDWGRLGGEPYQNRVALSLDVRGDKICGYREYFGGDGKPE